jgi:hypothetical protein
MEGVVVSDGIGYISEELAAQDMTPDQIAQMVAEMDSLEEGFQTFVHNTCSAFMDGTKEGYIKGIELLFAMRDADEKHHGLGEQVVSSILQEIQVAMNGRTDRF